MKKFSTYYFFVNGEMIWATDAKVLSKAINKFFQSGYKSSDVDCIMSYNRGDGKYCIHNGVKNWFQNIEILKCAAHGSKKSIEEIKG